VAVDGESKPLAINGQNYLYLNMPLASRN